MNDRTSDHSSPSLPLWQQAAALASLAHRHEVRKDGCTPYISHPYRVALTVLAVFDVRDEEVITAALLHDTIEDTTIDYDDIFERFGRRVADLVACMTKDMRMVEAEREKAYDAQLAAGPWEARLLKLADVYDNLSDCLQTGGQVSTLDKAQRAVELAAGDPQLREPVRLVRELMQAVRAAAGG